MPYRPDVHMRLGPNKLGLGHKLNLHQLFNNFLF